MAPAAVYDFPLLKDDVTLLVQEAVLSTLEGNAYDHKKVWTALTTTTAPRHHAWALTECCVCCGNTDVACLCLYLAR